MKQHYVPPEGPLDANLIVLGESPERNEWQRRKLFIGESGDILNDVLRAAGMPRSNVYITNVIKDLLPPWGDNKRSFFFNKANPTNNYMAGILDVIEEIKTIRANGGGNVVLTLGNYALWALMQHEDVFKWRGSILESTIMPGLKVIPAIHPAFYINSRVMWHQLALLEWDVQRAVRESAFPEINRPDYDFIVDPTPEEIADAIQYFTSVPEVTADTEWYAPNKLAYIGFTDSHTRAITIPFRSQAALRAYNEILGCPESVKVWHNAMFDVVALHRLGIDVVGKIEDTMIAWNACWGDLRKKGLDMLCSLLTDQPYYKDEVQFVGKDDVQGQIYCCTDCVVTKKSKDEIWTTEFEETHGHIGYNISMSIMPAMIEASKLGILIDDDLREKMAQAHLEIANDIEDKLSKTIGYTINCRSPKQVAHLVYDQILPMFGLKRATRSTQQDYLLDLVAGSHNETLETIIGSVIRVRQNRKIVSSYLHEGIVDADGRVRTNWNLAGTRSGRLSSTIPWWPGLALQTVPEDARSIFIPDPGHIFMGFDYAQAEARVVAVLSYNWDLLDQMDTPGIDTHIELASQLYDIHVETLYERAKAAEAQGKSKDTVVERYVAKRSRHAFNYVEGPDTFRRHVNRYWLDTKIGLNQTEARNLRTRYMQLNPGLGTWWREVKAAMREFSYLENAFGRRRHFLGKITEDSHREGVSFVPQSTIADLTTQAIAKISARLRFGQVLLHTHDGALFQVPEEYLDEAYDIMLEEAVWPIRVRNEMLTVPADGKVGYSWGNMKKKG